MRRLPIQSKRGWSLVSGDAGYSIFISVLQRHWHALERGSWIFIPVRTSDQNDISPMIFDIWLSFFVAFTKYQCLKNESTIDMQRCARTDCWKNSDRKHREFSLTDGNYGFIVKLLDWSVVNARTVWEMIACSNDMMKFRSRDHIMLSSVFRYSF